MREDAARSLTALHDHQGEWVARTLARMAAQPSLDHLLSTALETFAERFGDDGGTLWVYDEAADATRLALSYDGGAVERVAFRAPLDPAGVRRDWDRAYVPALRRGEILVHDEAVLLDAPANLPYREFFLRRGIKTSLVAGLMLGERFLGFIAARSLQPRHYDAAERELACVLARQATLALYLTRLADDALDKARASAMLTERNRIAGEIHDSLAQALTGVVLQLRAARAAMAMPGADPTENLVLAEELARDGLTEARRSFLALRPIALERGHLGEALDLLARKVCVPGRVPCHYESHDIGELPLRPEEEDAAFRIAQEAVQNALRHAAPTHIDLCLCACSDGIYLSISDDGSGFDRRHLTDPASGGLRSMRERAHAVGAELEITSAEPRGTCVSIVFPVSFA